MQLRRFQIPISLLVALQLLIPAIAPWLHSFIECGGRQSCTSTPESEAPSSHRKDSTQGRCLAACCHDHSAPDDNSSSDSSGERHPDEQPPHDCAHCAICQALAAPRIVVSIVEISASPEQIAPLVAPDCADPLLGFGLPPQCRAPPIS